MSEEQNQVDEQQDSPYNSVMRLFLIPLLIVTISVGMFYAFGFITFKTKTVQDYLVEIKTGSDNKKWQAAYSMAGLLVTEDKADPQLQKELTREIIPMFKNRARYDLRVRNYLALALGYLKQSESVPVLIESLSDAEEDTVIYSVWALSVLEDPRAKDSVLPLLKDSRAPVRKIAAFAMGTFRDTSVVSDLKPLLGDTEPDVAWNAALSLSQLKDGSGVFILERLLDRAYLDTFPKLNDNEKEVIILSALQGVANLRVTELQTQIETLSEKDPSLKVRQAAILVLTHEF